jgi:uncharacterized protein YlaN (UPF0358 family)
MENKEIEKENIFETKEVVLSILNNSIENINECIKIIMENITDKDLNLLKEVLTKQSIIIDTFNKSMIKIINNVTWSK